MTRNLTIPGAGQAIVALREHAKLSQAELAKQIGWDRSRLCKYESNDLALSIPVIEEIATALGHRPESVVLLCLKQRYPGLGGSQVGELLDELVQLLSLERGLSG